MNTIVGMPWRKDDDDPKGDGENPTGDVMVMDLSYKENFDKEKYVLVPKRVHIAIGDLEHFGFGASCPR